MEGRANVKKAAFLCLLAMFAVASGGCGRAAAVPVRPAVVGQSTPPRIATLPVVREAEGHAGGLTEVLGGERVVVLAFFTTWCPVSKPALNALERVASQYRDAVTAVAVGMDAESPEIAQFVSKEGWHITFAVDRDGSIAKEMSVPTMPMIFVVDGGGIVRYMHAGYHGDEDDLALREEVGTLSREAHPETPAPELPDMAPSIAMDSVETTSETADTQETATPNVALEVERLKARATKDLEEALYLGAFNLAELATRKGPTDAEAWLILGAANTALNDRFAARAAYQYCVAGAIGPRVSECKVLLSTF